MRWKQEHQKSRGLEIITRFLFLPKTISGETRWLERATWEREYGVLVFDNFSSWLSGRIDIRWMND